MKLSTGLKKLSTTKTELARAIGVSQPRIVQLAKEGIVVAAPGDSNGGVLVVESLKNYYLRQSPAAVQDGGEIDINAERAKREAAERKIAELKLAKMDGSVYDARTVELVVTEQLSNLRTQLLGLPTKLAPLLEGKGKEAVYSLLTEEIESKLAELSGFAPSMFAGEEVEDGHEDGG